MKWTGLAIAIIFLAQPSADAGIFSKKKSQVEEVPGGHPAQLVTTNGVVVPRWASRRLQETPVPLSSKSWGRRPWALALSTQATPSATWARADQLGYGPAIPGYTNGPNGPGANYPMASVGAGEHHGWGPVPGLRNLFMPGPYPWVNSITGY